MPGITAACSFFYLNSVTVTTWEAEPEASKHPNHGYSSVDCTSVISLFFVRHHTLQTRSYNRNQVCRYLFCTLLSSNRTSPAELHIPKWTPVSAAHCCVSWEVWEAAYSQVPCSS